MYSWLKFRVEETYYGNGDVWVNLGYVVNDQLDDYFKNYDFSKFSIYLDFITNSKKDMNVGVGRVDESYLTKYKDYYSCTGLTTTSYGDFKAFGFKGDGQNITINAAGYTNDYGVKFVYDIGATNTEIFINLKSAGLSTNYIKGHRFYINRDNYRVTSSNPNAYPTAGVKDGYIR